MKVLHDPLEVVAQSSQNTQKNQIMLVEFKSFDFSIFFVSSRNFQKLNSQISLYEFRVIIESLTKPNLNISFYS
jgi:hypothetical protein